jgi:glycine/D-amino acid oxidase-like deaminating enzyme
MDEDPYRSLSLWHDTHPGPLAPRAPLASDASVDVAIVGAGFTGLWTAYYLKRLEPSLRVAIVEAEIAGFGASGRNGGWCLGTLSGMEPLFADPARREGAIALQRAMFDTVDEVGRVCEREGIDCHYAKGGSVSFASVPSHRDLLRGEFEHWQSLGFGEDDLHWLEPDACRARVGAPNLGGLFLAHCAALHPMRLVRGLADAVEQQGVALYERTPALAIDPGRVVTASGVLQAATVVRATEAYTNTLAGHARTLLPLHSMMIATEPLPETVWKEIGLGERETFADPRRIVIYGQRTADDRLAFGSRGNYFFGSGVRDRFSASDAAFGQVHDVLLSLFPILRDFSISHRWGGALGVPRNWRPSLGLDRASGLAWAGGYVGEGVAATNLAGRTVADLILERDSDRVALPWVEPHSRRWEPEPLRWLGVSAIRRAGDSLDIAELAGRPASRLSAALFGAVVRK